MDRDTKLKVFFSTTPFSVSTAPAFDSPEIYQVFRISRSSSRDTFTIFDIEMQWPGTLFWAEKFRYACIRSSSSSDGMDGIIGIGELSGFPMGFAGARVNMEVVCRPADYTEKLEAALEPVRVRLGRMAPETSDALLEMAVASVYVDPVTNEVSLTPFGGDVSRQPVRLFAEGPHTGSGNVFNIAPLMLADPSETFELEANARHMQQYSGGVQADVPVFKFFGGFDNYGFTGGDADHMILGLNGVRSRDGGLDVILRPKYVDPITCYQIPSVTKNVPKYSWQAGELRAAITARCMRDETAVLRVNTNIGFAPGAREKAGYLIGVQDMTGVNGYDQFFNRSDGQGRLQVIRMRNTRPSAFLDGDAIADASADVVDALVEIAVRRALEHVYCVQIQVETTAQVAARMTTRDTAELVDVRLPGGRAFGWVTGVNVEYGKSDRGAVTMLVPIRSATPHFTNGNYTGKIGATGGPISVRATLGAPAGYSPQKPGVIGAIEDADGAFFIEKIEISNTETDQLPILQEINQKNTPNPTSGDPLTAATFASRYAIDDPEDYIGSPGVSVTFRQHEIIEDVVDRVDIGTIEISVMRGISFE